MKTQCLLALVMSGLVLPAAAQRLPEALHQPHPVTATASRSARTTAAQPWQQVRYSWDAPQAAWVQPLLDRLTYTSSGQLAERVTADSATATAFQREVYSYDGQGNLVEDVLQTGNGTPWINEFRYLYSYDARQQLTEQLSQTWANGAWQTTDGYRYQNTYTGPALTERVVQLFKNGVFVDDTRFQYQLSNGQWSEAVSQHWNGIAWVNEEHLVDLTWYNWATQQPAGFRVQQWQSAGQWQDFQRHAISYAPTGTVVQLIEEATAGGWQNLMRYTQPIDAQGNSTGFRQEDWANGIWVLTSEQRAQLRYDAQSRLIRRTEQLYVPLLAQFVNQRRTNYSDFQLITPAARPMLATQQLRLFPQPATDMLELEADNLTPQAVTLEIRAATGQLVQRLSAQLRAGELRMQLPVHNLVPGWYSLHILMGQGSAVRRFIKE
ncbi:T9SS type A sorting domain-containing protein [Hymenobacter pini]|uniref:T9SS type A sorting domain-containing protein n=1 Tax=Hymenobacter pini TaxID=2880879 RepID=UPI001CF2D317|nr:T9SS type A sorting domain-containing protein [Hymenobacter pini]MCA8832669.1 T9SS type A sorting domain-containing protein [Hymenobacter pini]